MLSAFKVYLFDKFEKVKERFFKLRQKIEIHLSHVVVLIHYSWYFRAIPLWKLLRSRQYVVDDAGPSLPSNIRFAPSQPRAIMHPRARISLNSAGGKERVRERGYAITRQACNLRAW